MFKVTDKCGQDINLKDEVKFTIIQDDMFNNGEEKELTGIIISINSETTVSVQPEEGASFEVETSQVEVIDSLINDVKKMSTTDDMKEIIRKAEERYAKEVQKSPSKGGGGGSRKKATPAVTGTLKL